ncbi:MAG: circularly permuted type 2 ATP-grasp protein [Ancalomicrobiaceae bacterium]|nr:circularly permuted type 2 ATP-grasp protein [Ancalomicrobiaceae bacterium]
MAKAFDEMTALGSETRSGYELVKSWLANTPTDLLKQRQHEAELLFRRIGITFNVYGDAEGEERLIPFDIIPRILTRPEWDRLSKGLTQRVTALNMFLKDVYGKAECLRAGIIPEDLVYRNPYFRPEMLGLNLPHDIYVMIAGIDIVRVDADTFYVLEDNARTPSGVSYMLENREVMLRLFPELCSRHRIAPVENYADELLNTLKSLAPRSASGDPTVAVLTPGPFNSAFYEHSFLADKLGAELVEGRDLYVRDNVLFMRTTEGPKRVDVVYRRVDDDFIDPLSFRPDSVLGVPGLMSAYRAGNLTLANAVGTGVADDKAVYSYMPEIIRFFTGEDAILKNVPTYRCREPDAVRYVLEHIEELVVKEVDGSGGYGMLVGPKADKATCATFREKVAAHPEKFIAQPTLALSTCPTFVGEGVAPRHVDLRPYVLTGADGVRTIPGGLTRVALKEGSLVVNSSQGGGTKDTWVVDPFRPGAAAEPVKPVVIQTSESIPVVAGQPAAALQQTQSQS